MKILVTDKIANEAMTILREKHEVVFDEMDRETLIEEISPYHALVVRGRTKVRKDVLENAENLVVIGRAGVGVDNIDVKECSKKKIKVVNSPTGATISVAELTISHMLSLSRNLTRADKSMKEVKWEKKKFGGTELNGKILGLIGIGKIGSLVAKYAKAFQMEVLVYDPYLSKDEVMEMGAKKVEFDDLFGKADYISIHVPLTDQTKHLINEKAFNLMKPTSYLINCARGGIVDENALLKALEGKRIAGAALDVFEKEPPTDSPLLKLENVVLTPHLGASTREGQQRAGTVCAQQVLMALDGKEPEFWVNRRNNI